MTPDPDLLRVGFVPGVTLGRWRARWHERLRAGLDLVEVDVAHQRRVLDDGDVDLCFVRLPVERDGLHLIPLYDEAMVAWVAADHPVAAFDEVTVADLAGEDLLHDVDDAALDRVNAGAVLLVPMSVARSASRRDLRHRPVTDAEPSSVGLAWRRDHEHPLIEEFIGIVRGRTANSSRTVRERAASPTPAASATPAPAQRRPKGRTASRPPRRPR